MPDKVQGTVDDGVNLNRRVLEMSPSQIFERSGATSNNGADADLVDIGHQHFCVITKRAFLAGDHYNASIEAGQNVAKGGLTLVEGRYGNEYHFGLVPAKQFFKRKLVASVYEEGHADLDVCERRKTAFESGGNATCSYNSNSYFHGVSGFVFRVFEGFSEAVVLRGVYKRIY